MNSVKQLETLGTGAVKKLRKLRLTRGDFFMINVNHLQNDECYLEFPDGIIKLARTGVQDFIILRDLDSDETTFLRNKLSLDPIK
jgi:hypothetical protein